MKSFFAVLVLGSFSFAGTAMAAGYYCIATPSHNNARVPKLPGYGHGRTIAASTADAIRSCKSRNAIAKNTCRVRDGYCFRE